LVVHKPFLSLWDQFRWCIGRLQPHLQIQPKIISVSNTFSSFLSQEMIEKTGNHRLNCVAGVREPSFRVRRRSGESWSVNRWCVTLQDSLFLSVCVVSIWYELSNASISSFLVRSGKFWNSKINFGEKIAKNEIWKNAHLKVKPLPLWQHVLNLFWIPVWTVRAIHSSLFNLNHVIILI